MDDAVKILTAKFKVSTDILKKVSDESEEVSSWLTVLGAYILDNDKKQEEQRDSEALLRKQRLNAEHQLGQLEKQLITCNVQLSKYEKNFTEATTDNKQKEEAIGKMEKELQEILEQNKTMTEENASMTKNYGHLENEKGDFSAMLDKKNLEIDRLNEEWQDVSKKLAEANKTRYEMQYKLDEIKNSGIRKEFKEKRLEQEKTILQNQLNNANVELKTKTETLNSLQKDKTASLLDIQLKHDTLQQEHLQLQTSLDIFKKKSGTQEAKIEALMNKLKSQAEEHVEAINNMQQELTAQTKLVQLYKDDRDHAKEKLEEITNSVSELQALVKVSTEGKIKYESELKAVKEVNEKKNKELDSEVQQLRTELLNANELLQVSRKAGGSKVVTNEELSNLSPLAAATSAILKKGMSLSQIYTEYVKTSDELLLEKEENERLKLYMEQILQEVEEKAPLLMQQKEAYLHAKKTVDNMSGKLEENIKECQRLQSLCNEYERKVDFHKREEKRLHSLCVDLSQQVRILLKEVEEARGGVVSSSNSLPELLSNVDESNASSSGQVISEHLVTFKSIEELQQQNQRLLLTVRELSEEQEKLEQEGGPEIIQELKNKIESAKLDLDSLRENHKTQDNMLQQLTRQRDMYKVLCQQGGVMVGEISSTSVLGSKSVVELESEITKLNAEHDNTLLEQKKLREEMANKERSLNDTISKQTDEVSSNKLERDRMKNEVEFCKEKYSILQTTCEGYKKEANALENKCKSTTEILGKVRAEAESFKQSYNEAREKLISAEVNVKSLVVEKDLIKEAEKRIMQENQSLLDQQRSQNVLLNNLQTIQNNLERQEFETRQTLSKQVDTLQREVKALRRQRENEAQQLKSSAAVFENEIKELQVKLEVEKEKNKQLKEEFQSTKQLNDQLETKSKELELQTKATEERLDSVLEREASGKAKEDYQREMERYKTKVRELELAVGNVTSGKKAVDDQLEITKKHLEQYKEICDSSEIALSTLNKTKDDAVVDYENKVKTASETIQKLKADVSQHVAEIRGLKKANEEAEKTHQCTVSELRSQMAPLERRFQEVTRALVHAKEIEMDAVKESREQAKLAKDAQEKYEKEIVLHGKDVEILTQLKDELKDAKTKYGGIEEREAEMKQRLENIEQLMDQMKEHHRQEISKWEVARNDLMNQNSILHGQVEKLSAQLAAAKTQTRTEETNETFTDKSIEEVYELLRFVRREKEIAETKAEASETESMRYKQRSEHLQRDVDETTSALALEVERTKGHMLTEEEHKNLLEKVSKSNELEEINKNLEKEKAELEKKNKASMEKNKKFEADFKPLQANKKMLEGEKSAWLAEKTALKQEIDRWTNRTNQLMAQSSKGDKDQEEIKRLQATKVHSEKAISSLQEEVRRTKQQLDSLKRESLKLKSENNELQSKIASLQNELKTAANKTSNTDQIANLQKENEEIKKMLDKNHADLTDKNKIIPQLKRLAKKYKVQCDKLQKILKEHNIPFESAGNTPATPTPATVTTTTSTDAAPALDTSLPAGDTQPPTSAGAQVKSVTLIKPITDEERKRLDEQLAECMKRIGAITKELDEVRASYDADKNKYASIETKLEETQKIYGESEKNVLELKKSLETVQAECNEKEKEKEKNRKLLKTARDKISSLTKNKDSSSREMENLKMKNEELQRSIDQAQSATVEQANSFNAVRVQLDVKIINLEKQVEALLMEKRSLMERLEEVQRELETALEQKKAADKFIKAASKQKSRIQAVASHGDPNVIGGSDASTNTPLTATVRPNSTPSSQATSKFHPQSTRTASIRPLAHAAPTAMISPTVPITQSGAPATLVASVAALPIPLGYTPQVAEIQGRSAQGRQLGDRSGLSFKAPVARVQVQAQGREEESVDVVPSMDDEQIIDQQPGPSSSNEQQRAYCKRSRVETTEEVDDDDISLLEDTEAEPSGVKRQRVENMDDNQEEQLITDSQEGQLEEELLGEEVEEGDDDVIGDLPTQQYAEDMPSQGSCVSREVQLQMERQLQPSPQELLRQSRLQGRVRTQLPSFSLVSGQTGSGFYEETDDSTVPSTPTLFMPKRTDGFAEAVSSPVVRFPAFSFSSNEQTSGSAQTSALELPGMHLHETRVELMSSEDQANVPQTPLSVVPSVSGVEHGENQISSSQDGMPPQRDNRRVSFGEQQFFPEDNGQEQNVPQQIDLTEDDEDEDDEHDLAQASEEMGDVITEDGEEAIDIMGNDTDLVDLDEDGEDEEDEDEEEDIESESEESEDTDSEKDANDPDIDDVNSGDFNRQDVVEIQIDDEDSFGDEEKEKVQNEEVARQQPIESMSEEKTSPSFGVDDNNVDAPHDLREPIEGSASAEMTSEQPSSSTDLKDEDPTEEEKTEEIEKTKPVRITRTSRLGVRPRIRRTTNLTNRYKSAGKSNK